MRIKISKEESQVAGFISWSRLATSLFPAGGEIKSGEKVVTLEISERGINYFTTPIKPETPTC